MSSFKALLSMKYTAWTLICSAAVEIKSFVRQIAIHLQALFLSPQDLIQNWQTK